MNHGSKNTQKDSLCSSLAKSKFITKNLFQYSGRLRFKYQILSNSNGVGLIGVLTAVGITSVLIVSLMSIMSANVQNSERLKFIGEADTVIQEVGMQMKSDPDLCLALVAGQDFVSTSSDMIMLRNQKEKFDAARSDLSASGLSADQITYLQDKYSRARSKVPAYSSATVGCLNNEYCSGQSMGRILIQEVGFKVNKNIFSNVHILDLILNLKDNSGFNVQRRLLVNVQTSGSGTNRKILDCQGNNTTISSQEVCDPTNPSKCVKYEDIEPLLALMDNLAGGMHKAVACYAFAGATVVDASGVKVCRIPGDSCPSGWTKFQSWSTTTARTCPSGCHSSGGGSTGSHPWSNIDPSSETCSWKKRKKNREVLG